MWLRGERFSDSCWQTKPCAAKQTKKLTADLNVEYVSTTGVSICFFNSYQLRKESLKNPISARTQKKVSKVHRDWLRLYVALLIVLPEEKLSKTSKRLDVTVFKLNVYRDLLFNSGAFQKNIKGGKD